MNVITEIGYGKAAAMCAALMEPYKEELKQLLCSGYNCATARLAEMPMFLAGSTAINGSGNDVDVVLDVSYDSLADVAATLDAAGWHMTSAEVYRGINSDGWFSAKQGQWNLLVSESAQVDLWNRSTRACVLMAAELGRPLTRQERVRIHNGVWDD